MHPISAERVRATTLKRGFHGVDEAHVDALFERLAQALLEGSRSKLTAALAEVTGFVPQPAFHGYQEDDVRSLLGEVRNGIESMLGGPARASMPGVGALIRDEATAPERASAPALVASRPDVVDARLQAQAVIQRARAEAATRIQEAEEAAAATLARAHEHAQAAADLVRDREAEAAVLDEKLARAQEQYMATEHRREESQRAAKARIEEAQERARRMRADAAADAQRTIDEAHARALEADDHLRTTRIESDELAASLTERLSELDALAADMAAVRSELESAQAEVDDLSQQADAYKNTTSTRAL